MFMTRGGAGRTRIERNRRGLWGAGLVASLVLSALVVGLAPEARSNGLPETEPGLFLTWRAPHGDPRAVDRLEVACTDTTRSDTLYLSFRSTTLPRVSGMSAVVYFTPVGEDTLGDFWAFKTGWPNGGNVFVETYGFPCEFPWRRMGTGSVGYDHRSGRGRLDISYSVPDSVAQPILEGRTYCLARVIIHQRRSFLSGCTQPMCVEWSGAWIRYFGGREHAIEASDQRFASWNALAGPSCADQARPKSAAQPWRPKPKQEKPPR